MIGTMAEKIAEAFKGTFPDLHVSKEYPKNGGPLKTPALIFELLSADAAEKQPATGQLDVDTRWEARLICGGKPTANYRLKARDLSLTIASFVNGNNFGIPMSMLSRFIRMADDGNDPEMPTLETWIIEWSQMIRVGKDLNDDGTDWRPQRIHILHEGGETTYPSETQ